jgi:hypothetical protein
MDESIERSSLSDKNKRQGELNVYFVYAILVASAIVFLVFIRHIK